MNADKPIEMSKQRVSRRWKMPRPKFPGRHSLLGKSKPKESNPMHLTNHRRMIFIRAHRMGISIEDYLKLCNGEVIEEKAVEENGLE